jgi:hypothetical protein
MPRLAVTYKGTFLLFNLTQEDLDGTLEDIRVEPILISKDKMIKELDCIESEINNYNLSYGDKEQKIMLEEISNKMMKSYSEIIATWIYNTIKLIMMEDLITSEQNNYFTFEDNDELTILYRSLLFDNNVL